MDVRVRSTHRLFTAAEPFELGPVTLEGTVHRVARYMRRVVMGRRYVRYVVEVEGTEYTLSPEHCERA